MKVKERKYIALVTLISMLIASFIPAQSFALEESRPEVLIVVEEMDYAEDSEIITEEEETEEEEESEEESEEYSQPAAEVVAEMVSRHEKEVPEIVAEAAEAAEVVETPAKTQVIHLLMS